MEFTALIDQKLCVSLFKKVSKRTHLIKLIEVVQSYVDRRWLQKILLVKYHIGD